MARRALAQGAEVLVFPELFLTGFCYNSGAPGAQDFPPYPSLNPFKKLVQEHDCLILGSVRSGRRNLGFCLHAEGLEVRSKIHPFGQEKEHFDGGDSISPINARRGKIGLEVCYDLRFPEVARSLAIQGADILVTVAQFPAARRAHWQVLCQARAIENQIPHLACNFAEGGGSLIVDAWGEIVAETGFGEAILLGEIDLDRRDAVRKDIPCFADRRPGLY